MFHSVCLWSLSAIFGAPQIISPQCDSVWKSCLVAHGWVVGIASHGSSTWSRAWLAPNLHIVMQLFNLQSILQAILMDEVKIAENIKRKKIGIFSWTNKKKATTCFIHRRLQSHLAFSQSGTRHPSLRQNCACCRTTSYVFTQRGHCCFHPL